MASDRGQLRADASDDTLWRSSRSGDQGAFAALYERHASTIYNYLFRRVADWSEAEDLTAVVFLEAYRRRSDAVIVDGKLLPWLYGIATNVLRNRRRAQWRHRRLLAQLASEPGGETGSDVHARVEAAEQMRSVLNHITSLPRAQQDVIALCTWSGLSYEEAAVALGVPVGTVRSRLSRARASLAELESAPGHKQVDMERRRRAER
ncbi:MAG: sigma-70 family RNA polymerase sigma factor [Actinobacteria bacterium]|nr:sigma-70 family RNA polymerase sigma factor [Actinomycetota bacterium]